MSPLLVRRCGDGSTVIHLFDVWPPLKPLRHTRHTSFPATPCCPASPTKGQSSPPSSPSRNTTDGWHGTVTNYQNFCVEMSLMVLCTSFVSTSPTHCTRGQTSRGQFQPLQCRCGELRAHLWSYMLKYTPLNVTFGSK